MELETFFESLGKYEKEDLKFLILLFPCYYFLYYLYYFPFIDLTALNQCVIAAATTVILYTLFRAVVFGLAILENFAGVARMSASVFRNNILFIVVGIVWGFFGGYAPGTLYKVCWTILALLLVQFIYLLCRFLKRSIVRGIKNSPSK